MTTRKSRREFLRLAAIGSAGVALAACGGGGGGGAAPAEEAAEPAAGGEAAAPAAEGIVLQQWYHEYGEAGTQEAVYRIAEEYSNMTDGVTIEVTWTPGNYQDKLNPALAAGTGPDVYENQFNLSMVRAGHVIPLNDLYTPEVKADFDEKDLALLTVDDNIYGIRMIIDTGLLYSRNSILEEAGIEHPTTWEELFEASVALTTGRQKGLFLGNDGGIASLWHVGPWAAGLDFLNDTPEIVLDPAAFGEVYAGVEELNQSDSLLIGSPTDWWDPSAFTQGLAAMQWTGLWAMPGIRDQIEEDFTVTQFPAIDIGNGQATFSTFWGGWVQFVNGAGEHIDESKAYANWQWIENTDWQNEWATAYGFHVPPRKSAAATNTHLTEGNAKVALDGLYAYGRDNGPFWTGAMTTAVQDAFSAIVKNDAPPEETMQGAKEICETEMASLMQG